MRIPVNRRKIFGWLAGLLGVGAASAQRPVHTASTGGVAPLAAGGIPFTTVEPGGCFSDKGRIPCPITPEWIIAGKAMNGQCPVCGAMAEKKNYAMAITFGEPYFDLVRCGNCNAAFYRDVSVHISPK